jgi:hypothetical protein
MTKGIAEEVEEYLEWFRAGDRDRAFFGLLEMPDGILSELMEVFHNETSSSLREFLVEVIWQHRQQSSIPFLAQALFDSSKEVWKQALDGLVTLASPLALSSLEAARCRQFSSRQELEEFQRWIDEAVEQIKMEVRNE